MRRGGPLQRCRVLEPRGFQWILCQVTGGSAPQASRLVASVWVRPGGADDGKSLYLGHYRYHSTRGFDNTIAVEEGDIGLP